ncbi:hypothetical protein P7266_1340 [Lactococcus cremoris]|nr:hypothetical protein P7266_1340 [Lactococcus cremoris]
MSIERILKVKKNQKYIYEVLSKKLFHDMIDENSVDYIKFIDYNLEDFILEASNSLSFNYIHFLITIIENRSIAEVNSFFLNDNNQVENVENRLNENRSHFQSDVIKIQQVNFENENKKLINEITKIKLALQKEKEKNQKYVGKEKKINKKLSELEKNKERLTNDFTNKIENIKYEYERKIKDYEWKINHLSERIEDKNLKIEKLDEIVNNLKIQEDKKKLLVVGRLSNNIVKKFPNFLIVNIAIDDQLMKNLKIELSKNYFAVFILKYQTNTTIQRKIKRKFNNVSFLKVENTEDFMEEVSKYEI